MKFTCLQENLEKGLATIYKAIPTKAMLPILSSVLLETKDGRIKLSATNTETAITTYVGASIEQDGITAVPAKLIKDFISTLSPNTLDVYMDDNMLHVSSERTKSKFNTIDVTDFPQLPTIAKDAKCLTLDPKEFFSAISSVVFAAASDESRPVFSGIYLNCVDGTLIIAACDGFRLSEKTLTLTNKDANFSTILPAKTLAEIARIFSNATEPIKFVLSENENLALFESDDTLVSSRIIDGTYPDYKRIIPTSKVLTATFLAQELLEAVKLINVFSKEASSAVRIKFNQDGTLNVTSATQETGQHQSNIKSKVEGDEIEIAFNSKFLLDFLTNVKSEKLLFEANGSVAPCLIKPIDQEDFIHIVMPMQSQ